MNQILGFSDEYRWLSNFYKLDTPIIYNDIIFPTVEHAYQAMKCENEDDMQYISQLTAGQAKRAGKLVKMHPGFEDNKVDVMMYLLELKFSQPTFRDLLLNTGDMYIEETNNWNDTFWGVCGGIGENNLGKLIMIIRTNLKNG